jgi:hypothetical protein
MVGREPELEAGQRLLVDVASGPVCLVLEGEPGIGKTTGKPGFYVEACFMDTQDGREHVQLGMERLIRIVK